MKFTLLLLALAATSAAARLGGRSLHHSESSDCFSCGIAEDYSGKNKAVPLPASVKDWCKDDITGVWLHEGGTHTYKVEPCRDCACDDHLHKCFVTSQTDFSEIPGMEHGYHDLDNLPMLVRHICPLTCHKTSEQMNWQSPNPDPNDEWGVEASCMEARQIFDDIKDGMWKGETHFFYYGEKREIHGYEGNQKGVRHPYRDPAPEKPKPTEAPATEAPQQTDASQTEGPTEAPCNPEPDKCQDDPCGNFADFGGCVGLITPDATGESFFKCSDDMNHIDAEFPEGYLFQYVCPVACEACDALKQWADNQVANAKKHKVCEPYENQLKESPGWSGDQSDLKGDKEDCKEWYDCKGGMCARGGLDGRETYQCQHYWCGHTRRHGLAPTRKNCDLKEKAAFCNSCQAILAKEEEECGESDDPEACVKRNAQLADEKKDCADHKDNTGEEKWTHAPTEGPTEAPTKAPTLSPKADCMDKACAAQWGYCQDHLDWSTGTATCKTAADKYYVGGEDSDALSNALADADYDGWLAFIDVVNCAQEYCGHHMGNTKPTTAPEKPKPTTAPEKPKPTTAPEKPKPTTAPEKPKPTTAPEKPRPTTAPEKPKPTEAPVDPPTKPPATAGCSGKSKSTCTGKCKWKSGKCKDKYVAPTTPVTPPVTPPAVDSCASKKKKKCKGSCKWNNKKSKCQSTAPATPVAPVTPVVDHCANKTKKKKCTGSCKWNNKKSKCQSTAPAAPVAPSTGCGGKSQATCTGKCKWKNGKCKAKATRRMLMDPKLRYKLHKLATIVRQRFPRRH